MAMASVSFAQTFPPSGFYHIQNVKSSRYITMIDSYGALNMAAGDADMGALRTYSYSEEKVVSNPAAVIYVLSKGGDKYDLQAQGTGCYDIVRHVLQLNAFNDGTYGAYASMSGITKYLYEYKSDFGNYGCIGINNPNSSNKAQRWNLFPVSSSDATNYFGIKADIQVGNDWYKSFYASFGFNFASPGMKAYYVSRIDPSKGLVVYEEISGSVPTATPVFVKCVSANPSENRLNLLYSTEGSILVNKLKGQYFCCTPEEAANKKHENYLEYDPATMRVLGVTADGSLGYIKAPDTSLFIEGSKKYIPANTSYLVVNSDAPAQLKLVTPEEYETYKSVTVTARSYERVYGDENPTFEYDVTGMLNGEPKLECEATVTSPVGTYPITVSQGTVTGTTITGIAGTLTIIPAPLNVKADDKSRVEGTENPELTVTYTGFKNNEDASVLDVQPTVTTTATKESAPGAYPITVSGGSAKNYTLSYENGTLTVTEGSLTLTAKSYTREYGEENPVFEFEQSGATTLKGTPAITCEATKTSPVGTYPIVIAQGTVENGNVTYVNGTLTITAAPLKVKADDKSRVEGTENPELTVTYTGFKNNEDASVLDEQPTVTTTATKESAPGIYPITVSGGKAKNYTLSYEDGTLTITEGSLMLTAKSYEREYGDENPVFEFEQSGTTTLKGMPVITCEATKESPVGTYDIVIAKGTVENGNVTYINGTLTITKAPLTVAANDVTREKGMPNPEFTLTYSGWKNGENQNVLDEEPVAATEANEYSEAGDYEITVSGGRALNYEFIYVSGKLTVTSVQDVLVVVDEENSNTEVLIVDEENGTAAITGVEAKNEGEAVETVVIPETVTNGEGQEFTVNEIAAGTFEDMTTIETVIIPSTVEKIGVNAFAGCTGLTKLVIHIEVPIDFIGASARGMNSTTGDDFDPVFSGVDKDVCVLYVPYGCKEKYEVAPVWCTFKNIVEMDPQGISEVVFKAGTSSNVYTLSGMKVSVTAQKNLPAGIYVVNGKKVMVK